MSESHWSGGILGLCFVIIVIIAFARSDKPETNVKNRVPMPMLGEQLQQAQQAAADAKAAAQQAQKIQTDLQAQIDKLDKSERNSNSELKEGRAEVTGVGNIVEFGEPDSLSFLFVEEGGFSKRFYPVCGNQTLPVNKTIALRYHWRPWDTQQQKGCYIIDSFTIQQ